MYLYGAGGHAKVILDILNAQGIEVKAFVDDNEHFKDFKGYPVIHRAERLSPFIVSIGTNKVRKSVAERLKCEFGQAIHPSAIVSASAVVSEGSVIMQGAIVQADAVIGRHVIINTGATVDHECIVGDYAHISPNATLCGNVQVGEGTQIGAGSVVTPGVKIGKWSLICAGSVIIKDIPDYCIANSRYGTLKTKNMYVAYDKIIGGGNSSRPSGLHTPLRGIIHQSVAV